MKRSRESQLEYKSWLALRNLLPKAWIVRDKDPDVGIDMEIEIVEGEEVTNKVIWIQLKATADIYAQKEISYLMKTKHLKYYEGCRLPVVILYWIKSKNEFYYLFAQKYIREIISEDKPNWRKQKKVTIKFHPNSKIINIKSLENIVSEGYFYLLQQQLNKKLGAKGEVAIYWLDGIPKSDNIELKEYTRKALDCYKREKLKEAIRHFEDALIHLTISPVEKMSLLLNLGWGYYALSKYEQASKVWEDLIEISQKVRDKSALEGKVNALRGLAYACKIKGDFLSALKYVQEALEISKKIEYLEGITNVLNDIAETYSWVNDVDSAHRYCHEALMIDKKNKFKKGEAGDLFHIGLLFQKPPFFSTTISLSYLLRALNINRQLGDKEFEADILKHVGLTYINHNLEKSIEYLDQALKICREIGWKSGEASVLSYIGGVYIYKWERMDNSFLWQREINQNFHELYMALKYYQEALGIDRKGDFKKGEAFILKAIGKIYDDMNRFKESLQYYKKALKIYQKIGNMFQQEEILNSIEILYSKIGDSENATKYHQMALKVHEGEDAAIDVTEFPHKQKEVNQLNKMVGSVTLFGNLDDTLEHHIDFLNLSQFTKDSNSAKQFEAEQMSKIGIIWRIKKNWDSALTAQLMALGNYQEVSCKDGEAEQLSNIAYTYLSKGDLDNALKYNLDALKIYYDIGPKQMVVNHLISIGLIYSDKHDIDNSLKYLKDALKIIRRYDLYGYRITQNAIDSIKIMDKERVMGS